MNKEIYDKKAKTAIGFDIISFLYYLIAGVISLVLIAFRAPTEALIMP